MRHCIILKIALLLISHFASSEDFLISNLGIVSNRVFFANRYCWYGVLTKSRYFDGKGGGNFIRFGSSRTSKFAPLFCEVMPRAM